MLGREAHAAKRIAESLAKIGRSVVFIAPSDIGMGKSTGNRQLLELQDHLQQVGPLNLSELTAVMPPSDDPFKPCRRSKGEKARNRKQRRG